MLCGPLKSSLTRRLIAWWALRAEKQGYCASKLLTAPPTHQKKKEVLKQQWPSLLRASFIPLKLTQILKYTQQWLPKAEGEKCQNKLSLGD